MSPRTPPCAWMRPNLARRRRPRPAWRVARRCTAAAAGRAAPPPPLLRPFWGGSAPPIQHAWGNELNARQRPHAAARGAEIGGEGTWSGGCRGSVELV